MSDADAEGILGLLLRLRAFNIMDPAFLKAVESVPHEKFVPVEYFASAWADCSLPIACGQTMHAPDTTIRMIHALQVNEKHNVLEVGTGSGYQTALLSRLAGKVKTLDRYQTLLDGAKQRLDTLNISNVTYEKHDGRKGAKGQGLFDRIIVDSAYDALPRDMLEQMVAGGVLIAAIGEPGRQQALVKLTKIGSRFDRVELFPVRFSMLETGEARAL